MSFRHWLWVTVLLAVASCWLVSSNVFALETTGAGLALSTWRLEQEEQPEKWEILGDWISFGPLARSE
jgi:hypothetical protein